MSEAGRYATVAKSIAAVLAVLGLWIVVAPFVLAGAEFETTHVVVGAITAAVAAGYGLRLHRDPETKIPSIWFLLVLGALLLAGALLAQTPGTVYFWSTVVASTLTILLAVLSIVWGSRFAAGRGQRTTIFEK